MNASQFMQKFTQYWSAHKNTGLGSKIILNQLGAWRSQHPTVEVTWKPTGQRFLVRPNSRDLNEIIAVAAGHEYPKSELLSLGADPIFIDAGGHIGTFSCWAAQLRPDARIVTIESEPGNLALLQRNLTANCLASRVSVLNGALAPRSGVTHLELSQMTNGHQITQSPSKSTIEVKTWSLAQIIAEAREATSNSRAPILLKMDIEGAEYEVLPAAKDVLPQIQVIFLEWHWKDAKDRSEKDTFLNRFLRESGFSISDLSTRIKIATRTQH